MMRSKLFESRIQFRAPYNFGAALEAAAKKEHTTVSEWLRRAAKKKLRESGIKLNKPKGSAEVGAF